jgi:Mg2+ and Co2+ transporter CorA
MSELHELNKQIDWLRDELSAASNVDSELKDIDSKLGDIDSTLGDIKSDLRHFIDAFNHNANELKRLFDAFNAIAGAVNRNTEALNKLIGIIAPKGPEPKEQTAKPKHRGKTKLSVVPTKGGDDGTGAAP